MLNEVISLVLTRPNNFTLLSCVICKLFLETIENNGPNSAWYAVSEYYDVLHGSIEFWVFFFKQYADVYSQK